MHCGKDAVTQLDHHEEPERGLLRILNPGKRLLKQHPSEYAFNIRIQTDGSITAHEALGLGLDNLIALSGSIKTAFADAIAGDDIAEDDISIAETDSK